MNESIWNIDTSKLANYKKEGWREDYFASTPKNDFGILVYNIDEWRILSYAELLGIYSTPENPKLELNSGKICIWYDNEKTFSFLEKSNCIAVENLLTTRIGIKGKRTPLFSLLI